MLEMLRNLDGAVLLWIQEFLRNDVLSAVLKPYTMLGNAGLLWIAASLAMLCFRRTRRAGCAALLAMALGLLCTNVVLKHLAARPRPWLDVAGLVPLVHEPDPNSFPSGHTCAAFAAAGAWSRTLPERRMGTAGLILAGCMGLSRLYVGVHYPSDVIAGAAVGLLCAWCARRLLERRTKPEA
ncbi:MAG: phosphatase PAP2 family protein [Lawsonibacter sp.]|nr:phosphatase PAP2 family protein [Lawsonibacter sp.]